MKISTDVGRFAILPEWLLDSGVSPRALHLWAVLAAKYADRDGVAWPSRRTIAEGMSTGVRTVDRALKELVAIQAVRVEHQPSAAGDWDHNIYHLRMVPSATPGGANSVRTVVPDVTDRTKEEQPKGNHARKRAEIISEDGPKGESLSKVWKRRYAIEDDKVAVLVEAFTALLGQKAHGGRLGRLQKAHGGNVLVAILRAATTDILGDATDYITRMLSAPSRKAAAAPEVIHADYNLETDLATLTEHLKVARKPASRADIAEARKLAGIRKAG